MSATLRAVRDWYARVVRFALLGRGPAWPAELPVWGVCLPFVYWQVPVRYDGRTFADDYTKGIGRVARAVLPLRASYLLFLLGWPLVAFLRGVRRGRGLPRFVRHALARPDLTLFHPKADFTDREIAWGRPDHALGMFHAWQFARRPAPYFRLDDKRAFHAACVTAGLPVPRQFTVEEAIARGGEVVVKDPKDDLGYGVQIVDASELLDFEDPNDLVIQERLRNHPDLLVALPPDGPLSSFRVITTLDAKGNPIVTRCAIRIGHAGKHVDNTAQGGFWAGIDLVDGTIRRGVKKKDYGVVREGKRVEYTVHPDTGKPFTGVKIPWFDEGRALAVAAHRKLAPDALTLGWDLALSSAGPLFLEVNVWTASYDADPPDDALTPAGEAVIARMQR